MWAPQSFPLTLARELRTDVVVAWYELATPTFVGTMLPRNCSIGVAMSPPTKFQSVFVYVDNSYGFAVSGRCCMLSTNLVLKHGEFSEQSLSLPYEGGTYHPYLKVPGSRIICTELADGLV